MTRKEFIGMGSLAVAGTAIGRPKRGRIGSRRIFSKGESYPFDSEVEYLEATGTQWIDTGIVLNQSSTMEARVRTDTPSSPGFFFVGSRIDTYSRGMTMQKTTAGRFCTQFGTQQYDSQAADNQWHVFRQDGRYFFFDGRLVHTYRAETFTTPYSLLVFGCRQAAGLQVVGQKQIAYLRIWNNGMIVRDFFAVRFTNELGQTEGGLFDQISGEVFRNKGSGEFLIGPDV